MINKKIILGIGGLVLVGGGIVTTVLLFKNKNNEVKEDKRTEINIDRLNENVFEIRGGNTLLKISNINEVLPEEVEVKFYLGQKDNPSYKEYKDQLSNLRDGDDIKIKFFIKKEKNNTHKFPKNFYNPIIASYVNNNLKIEVYTKNLSADLFEFSGEKNSRTIKPKIGTIPIGVNVKYFKGASASHSSAWSLTAPQDLRNGEKVWVQFSIKNNLTHKFKIEFFSKRIISMITPTLK